MPIIALIPPPLAVEAAGIIVSEDDPLNIPLAINPEAANCLQASATSFAGLHLPIKPSDKQLSKSLSPAL